jgi:hypothetical protein
MKMVKYNEKHNVVDLIDKIKKLEFDIGHYILMCEHYKYKAEKSNEFVLLLLQIFDKEILSKLTRYKLKKFKEINHNIKIHKSIYGESNE